MDDQNESTAEKPVTTTKEEIIREAGRIEESTLYSSKSHFVSAQRWSSFHLYLGIPTTILAAIASATAFLKKDPDLNLHLWAGGLAALVAALTTLGTFLNPTKKAADHLRAGNGYDALNNKVRIFRTIECWGKETDAVLIKRLKDLSLEKDKLNRESPQPSKWAYREAKRGIEAGEAEFVVDRNKDLPV